MRLVFAAELQVLPLTVFAVVLAVTLGVTYWASKRTSTATEFWAAGRGVTGAPERLRDRRRLHVGVVVPRLRRPDLPVRRRRHSSVSSPRSSRSCPCCCSWPSGCATPASTPSPTCSSFRLRERPARVAAAFGTLAVVFVYLIAQMVGGGVLIQALTGHHVHAGRDRRRRVHADLRDLRRHARHHVGADHQGGAADDLRRRDHAAGAGQGRLQPLGELFEPRRVGAFRGRRTTSSTASSSTPRSA